MASTLRLSDRERSIIACIELRSTLSTREVARLVGCHERSASRTILQLRSREIIRSRPFINLAIAGYTYYGIYFSSSLRGRKRAEILTKRLMAKPEIVWLAEIGGAFELGMAVCVRTIYELYDLLRSLSDEFPGLFHRKAVTTQFTATTFGRGYLSPKFRQVKPLAVWSGAGTAELDPLDCRILAALSGGTATYREIARALAMPLSTLDLRIKKLEQKKVIAGWVCQVDSARFGMTTEKILVHARGLEDRFSRAVYDFAKEHPKVVAMYRCFGTWDFELNVETREPGEITAVVDELYERFQDKIVDVELITKYRELKGSGVPFTISE